MTSAPPPLRVPPPPPVPQPLPSPVRGTQHAVQPVRPVSMSVASVPAASVVRTKSSPFTIHLDLEPILWIQMYERPLRKGAFSLGWSVWEYDYQVGSYEDGFGLYLADAPEHVSYSQYHPHLPGGRL